MTSAPNDSINMNISDQAVTLSNSSSLTLSENDGDECHNISFDEPLIKKAITKSAPYISSNLNSPSDQTNQRFDSLTNVFSHVSSTEAPISINPKYPSDVVLNQHKLFISNIHEVVKESVLRDFFNALFIRLLPNRAPGDSVVSAWISRSPSPCISSNSSNKTHDNNQNNSHSQSNAITLPSNNLLASTTATRYTFGFIEFRSIEEADFGLHFNYIPFHGATLNIRRPKYYNDAIARDINTSEIVNRNGHLHTADCIMPWQLGLVTAPGGDESFLSVLTSIPATIPNSQNKVFIGGLPHSSTDANVLRLLLAYGPLNGFYLVTHKGGANNGQCKGYGFCEWTNRADAERAISQLNGLALGTKNLTVAFASGCAKEAINDSPAGNKGGGNSGQVIPIQSLNQRNAIADENAFSTFTGGSLQQQQPGMVQRQVGGLSTSQRSSTNSSYASVGGTKKYWPVHCRVVPKGNMGKGIEKCETKGPQATVVLLLGMLHEGEHLTRCIGDCIGVLGKAGLIPLGVSPYEIRGLTFEKDESKPEICLAIQMSSQILALKTYEYLNSKKYHSRKLEIALSTLTPPELLGSASRCEHWLECHDNIHP